MPRFDCFDTAAVPDADLLDCFDCLDTAAAPGAATPERSLRLGFDCEDWYRAVVPADFPRLWLACLDFDCTEVERADWSRCWAVVD